MMRSMYSGVSGLRAHQLKMDIIGNNIANVNTVGFKGQRVTFQEVYSQTIKGAGSPQTGRGGTNAQQVGLGISLSSIDTFHIRGAVQRTDNNTDLAVNGDGFFLVSSSPDYLSRSFTRAGNFALDNDGNLVASNGYKVLGFMVDPETGVLKSNLEGIKISKAEADSAKATTYSIFEGNLDNNLPKTVTTTIPVFTEATTTPIAPENLTFDKDSESKEATYQYTDGLGGQHNIKYIFVRGLTGTGTIGEDNEWGVYAQDLDSGNYYSDAGLLGAGTDLSTITIPIKFGADGKLDPASISKLTLTIPEKNGADSFDVSVDFSKLTQFAGESNAAITESDGYPQGFLDSFAIAPTGEINAVFTNGQNKIIGRIALAVFKNPGGLEKTTENMYQITPNSGDAIVGMPGFGGMGSINPGTLEMSNVDISREFTDMISTQRGFQANSRIITTSDEMLQELVNLKR
ncbi:MAG: flagellar hook protein FlgE [Lutisporaceae bacterium]